MLLLKGTGLPTKDEIIMTTLNKITATGSHLFIKED